MFSSKNKSKKNAKTILVNIDNKSKHDLVKKFNRELRWLMEKIYLVSGKSLKIESLKNKMFIGLSENFEMGLKHAGPEIWGFRQAIRCNDVDKFCNIDYSKMSYEDKDYDNNVIMMLQKEMPNFTKEEQTQMFKRVNGLLNMYLEFVLFEKQEKDLIPLQTQMKFKLMPLADYKIIAANRRKEKLEKDHSKKSKNTTSDSEDSSF